MPEHPFLVDVDFECNGWYLKYQDDVNASDTLRCPLLSPSLLENLTPVQQLKKYQQVKEDTIARVARAVNPDRVRSDKMRIKGYTLVNMPLPKPFVLCNERVDDACVICLEELQREHVKSTCCSVRMHSDCFKEMEENQSFVKCPVCKRDEISSIRQEEYDNNADEVNDIVSDEPVSWEDPMDSTTFNVEVTIPGLPSSIVMFTGTMIRSTRRVMSYVEHDSTEDVPDEYRRRMDGARGIMRTVLSTHIEDGSAISVDVLNSTLATVMSVYAISDQRVDVTAEDSDEDSDEDEGSNSLEGALDDETYSDAPMLDFDGDRIEWPHEDELEESPEMD
jgi:hypothetical protein